MSINYESDRACISPQVRTLKTLKVTWEVATVVLSIR